MTEEDQSKLETKLVDIMEDFELQDKNDAIEIKEEIKADGFCTLLNVQKKEVSDDISTTSPLLPWRVTPYDLGGHSPYFNSQKLFSASSSTYLLTFQRFVSILICTTSQCYILGLVSNLTISIQKLVYT